MIITTTIIVFVIFALVLSNWRMGLYLIILAGFIQDPVRKLMPDQPIYYSVIVIIVFSLCMALTFMLNQNWRVKHITLNNHLLEFILLVYSVFVVLSSGFSYLNHHNLLLSVFGLVIYMAPLVAVVYSNMVLDKFSQVQSFLIFYLFCISIVIITIWMSVWGFDGLFFSEISGGIGIYEHTINNYLIVHSGLMRTTEVAAWHLSAGACFSLILAISSRSILSKIIYVLLTLACLVTGIFTGRRKMYGLFAIFCLTLLMIVIYESEGKKKNFALLSICVIGVVVSALYVVLQQKVQLFSFANNYLSRVFTLVGDTADRISTTLAALEYTLQRMSFFGTGVGTTGQSISGVEISRSDWNAETGLGRLGNELGALGFIIFITTATVIFSHIVRTNRLITKYNSNLSFFQRAMVAFLFANAINYFNAAQAYNDLFILLINGFVLGCVLNSPKIFYSYFKQSSLRPV